MGKEEFLKNYEVVYRDLYRYALFSLGNVQDAEDVVSDAVMDAYKERESLKAIERFRSWIFTILVRKCKQKRKEYALKKDVSYEQVTDNNASEKYLEKDDGVDLQERVMMRQMLMNLDAEERQIILLHVIGGYTGKEIGKMLGMLPATVRSKEHRALKKLRQQIQE